MNDWTPEYRLRLISALASRNIGSSDPRTDPSWPDLAQRLAFLADMPAEFLEVNKHVFADAIRWAAMEEVG